MAIHNQDNGRKPLPDENPATWRPQDDRSARGFRGRDDDDDRDDRPWRDRSYHDDDRYAGSRDPQRWEGSRGSELGYYDDRGRSTERYGQGQSGYSAGRYGDDRSQGTQNRNQMFPPSPRGYQDRQDLGVDDRFTGRGSRPGDPDGGYWLDRGGYHPEREAAQGGYGGWRGFEPERLGPRSDWRPDDRMGYRSSSGARGQSIGYQNSSYAAGYAGYGWDERRGDLQHRMQSEPQRGTGNEPHTHRGIGPHRGRGPVGYQRSDERLREMICEQLTDDDELDASQIEVVVKSGEVTLSGTVDDRRAKRHAEDCVCSVSGVRDVQNQLRVKEERQLAKTSGSAQSSGSGQASQPAPGNGKYEAEPAQPDKKHRA
jgi:hypothetical protein